MRALSLGLLLSSLTAAAADFTEVDASVRSEVQARRFSGQQGAAGAGTLELLPQVGLVLQDVPVTLTLSYAPRVLFQTQDVGPAVSSEVLHRGRAAGEYRFTPDRRVGVVEQASYGQLDFLSAANSVTSPSPGPGGLPPALQPVPNLLAIPFEESASDAFADVALDRLTRGYLDVSYLYSGGVGAGQLQLPLLKRAQATGTLSTQATPTDALTTLALASQSSFSSGQTDGLASLTETWRHKRSPLSDLQLGLGLSFVRTRQTPAEPFTNLWLPGAILGFHEQFRGTQGAWTLDALGTLGPFVDQLTGHAYERAEGNLTLAWNDTPDRWIFTGRTRGAVAVFGGTQHGETIVSAEAGAAYMVNRQFKVEGGTRLLRQSVPQLGPQPYVESVTYLSITLTGRGIL